VSKGILIVEDEGLVSLEIEETIESLGYTVLGIVDTGEEAIAAAEHLNPDLVLMDIRLKNGMDGVEAATKIRERADIPIIFLTAYSSDEILRRASITEPYGYLLKPIQERQLAGALRMAWYRHGKDVLRDRNVERFAAILRGLPHGVVVVDRQLHVRYMNNRAKHLVGLTKFESWGRRLDEIILLNNAEAQQVLQNRVTTVIAGDRGATVGKQTVRSHLGGTKAARLDISPFTDRKGTVLGALIFLSVPAGDVSAEDESPAVGTYEAEEGGEAPREYYPPASEMGQLRSYLELEIIRLALSERTSDLYSRGTNDGQRELARTLLQIFFGDEAVREIEALVPMTNLADNPIKVSKKQP